LKIISGKQTSYPSELVSQNLFTIHLKIYMSQSLTTAAQNASPYSEPGKRACNFCGKEGLLILPVRCATLPSTAKAPAMPALVGTHIKKIGIGLSSYTLRTARVGYLYVLVNRKNALSWQCYISTASGYWSQFAADAPPLEAPEFTCDPQTHGINASMISIFEAVDVDTAYLLFTPSPLSLAMLSPKGLKSAAKADELCSIGQMVKFSPSKWVGGDHKQINCLDAAGVGESVCEFAVYDKARPIENSLTQAMVNATFPLMNDGDGEASKRNAILAVIPHLLRTGPLRSFMAEKKAVAVAFYDHIGVTQELNDFRNDALNQVDDFLNTPDSKGVSNRWKFDSLQSIRETKAAFEAGLASDTQLRHIDSELHIHAMHEPLFPDDTEQLDWYKTGRKKLDTYRGGRVGWKKEFPEKAAALEADLQKHRDRLPTLIANAKANARTTWEKKYSVLLDEQATKTLDDAFNNSGESAMKTATARVNDHLVWVLHERFLGALDLFDRDDVISGNFFALQVSQAVFGMTGTDKSAAQVESWLQARGKISRTNVYMRGLLLNQSAIEKEASTALAEAARVAAQAPVASKIDGDKMYKAVKTLADFFRKADSAWDEFLRNQEQTVKKSPDQKGNKAPPVTQKTNFHRTSEGKKLFLMSEMSRSIARAGITKVEMKTVGFLGGFLLARTGKLVDKFAFQEMMYGICPEKPNNPKSPKTAQTPDGKHVPTSDGRREIQVGDKSSLDNDVSRRQIAIMQKNALEELQASRTGVITDAERKHVERTQGIRYTAEEYVKDPKTNNYHQARLGVVLGLMESIALLCKLSEMRESGGNEMLYTQTLGNFLSVASISYDVAYALTKSTREYAQATKAVASVAGAADVARGGYKLRAGVLGALAGFAGIYADFLKLSEEGANQNRPLQKIYLSIRLAHGVINTGLGAAAAFSYSGPVFRRIAINLAQDAVRRRAFVVGAARIAERWAVRVVLLRWVAWSTGAGFALLAAEIIYYTGESIYMSFQPNALQIWCKRSAFRKLSQGGIPFMDSNEELQELARASQLVRGKQ
jgi:hypothetical protein